MTPIPAACVRSFPETSLPSRHEVVFPIMTPHPRSLSVRSFLRRPFPRDGRFPIMTPRETCVKKLPRDVLPSRDGRFPMAPRATCVEAS
ncbi:hypothetical protein AVEN_103057-1 [Araneus ventricosus]|uniref:Uncharacterized protein n=1 Tax=Araneus ventricosus TaxID=182803 RepID=A0A4Y2B7N4_ARAVE|nr:hypothetical protein AVEN_103057-1 [Araneus ventricosus]